MTEPTFPDWCPKQCGWRHWPDKPCPKTKLPMPVREPGMEPDQSGLQPLGRLLGEKSTLHEVEARCPICGVIRTLLAYAPPDKVTMDRLCDACAQPKRIPDRVYATPYKD